MKLLFRLYDQHGFEAEPRGYERRQAQPGRRPYGFQLRRLYYAQPQRKDITGHHAREYRQQADEAFQVDGDRSGHCEGGDRHKKPDGLGGGREAEVGVQEIGDGGRREVEAYYRHHCPGDHRRHQAVYPARTPAHGDCGGQRVQDRRAGYAREGEGDVFRQAPGDGQHGADEGEAGAQVAGHFGAGYRYEDQGARPGEENGRLRVEAHQYRGQHGGAEHRHHVLHPHRYQPGKRELVFGIIDFLHFFLRKIQNNNIIIRPRR